MPRNPNVPTETVIERIFSSEGGATRSQLGVSQNRVNALVERGLVRVGKATVKVLNEAGQPSRGRPAHVYLLTDKARARARRQAQRQAA